MPQLTDREARKKTNIRLALGVATVGVLGLFSLYVIFFAMMFFSPWLLPRIMPFPALSEQVAGIDGKLLIFSKEVHLKRASYESPPQTKMTLRTYDGIALSDRKEVPSFHSLYPAADKVYFFGKGMYRTFDGRAWTETKIPAIGNNPVGAADGGIIWVLSNCKGKPALNVIEANEARDIPLPPDAHGINVCSSQLLAVGGKVHLLWKDGYRLFWAAYDGEKWETPKTFDSNERYKAIVFQGKVFLFGSRPYGDKPSVILRTYDGKDWMKAVTLPVSESYIDILPAVFRERPILVLKRFFSAKYYVLDAQGQIAGAPENITRPFPLLRHVWKLAGIGVACNVFFFLIIFLMSTVIRRFKERSADLHGQYEYASLFRRFAAYFIDAIIISLPVAPVLFLFLREDPLPKNPLLFAGLILFSVLAVMVGGFLYHSFLEGLWGKTIGKKLCGIVVLGDDFRKCTLLKGFLRNILRIIDSFSYYLVAAVSLSATMKWQRLGDIVAGTVVVRDIRR